MIIDISFGKEHSIQDMIDRTINFCGLDYKSESNRYVCTQTMLFSIVPGSIHISSILETDLEIQFVKRYIRSLFENTVIAISSIGFSDKLRNIPDVEVIDITPKFDDILDEKYV